MARILWKAMEKHKKRPTFYISHCPFPWWRGRTKFVGSTRTIDLVLSPTVVYSIDVLVYLFWCRHTFYRLTFIHHHFHHFSAHYRDNHCPCRYWLSRYQFKLTRDPRLGFGSKWAFWLSFGSRSRVKKFGNGPVQQRVSMLLPWSISFVSTRQIWILTIC